MILIRSIILSIFLDWAPIVDAYCEEYRDSDTVSVSLATGDGVTSGSTLFSNCAIICSSSTTAEVKHEIEVGSPPLGEPILTSEPASVAFIDPRDNVKYVEA